MSRLSRRLPTWTISDVLGPTSLRYMHVARGATDRAIAVLQAADLGHHRGTAEVSI